MGRAGYSDDCDYDWWSHIRWRGQVASAIKGKRGQAFLRELIEALDALPEKELIANDLQSGSSVCAIGSVGLRRGLDMSELDPEDPEPIANAFGIASQMVREIEFMNDEAAWDDTPAKRWRRMRTWAADNLARDTDGTPKGGDGEAGSVRSTTAGAEGIAKNTPEAPHE